MIDDITDVGDVVGPVVLHGNVPTPALRVQRRHDEVLAVAQYLEATVSGLACRGVTTAVQIDTKGKR